MSDAAPHQDLLSSTQKGGLWALVALGLAALAGGAALGTPRLYPGVLVGYLFLLDLGLGGAVILAMNAASGARWDTVVRRVPEAMASTLPVGGAMVLVLLVVAGHLYPWAKPGFMDNPLPELAAKKSWLRLGFFDLRSVLYVAIWVGLTAVLLGLRRAQERDGLSRTAKIRRLSMLFLILFAYTFSLSSFDWVMSLEPTFYSTIFGVYCFGGVMQSGFAAILLLVIFLDGKGVFKDQVREQHLHDLGKWLFAFSCFWAYVWFFQYMLIWYADLPDENQYYLHRSGPLAYVMGLVVFGRFIVPFFGLASQRVKKDRRVLAAVATIVLACHWLDLCLMVLPSSGGMANIFALVLPLAAGAAFLLLFFRAFRTQPALPRRDAAYAYSRSYRT